MGVGWLSACWSMLLTEEVLATNVEFTAALVAAEFGECLLRKVRGVTFNGPARTQTKDKQY